MAFFEPGADGVTANTEDAGQAPERGAFVVGREDQRFGLVIIGVAARVLASVLFAVFASETQATILGVTVADEVVAAAMGVAQGLSKHGIILPHQTLLDQHRLF